MCGLNQNTSLQTHYYVQPGAVLWISTKVQQHNHYQQHVHHFAYYITDIFMSHWRYIHEWCFQAQTNKYTTSEVPISAGYMLIATDSNCVITFIIHERISVLANSLSLQRSRYIYIFFYLICGTTDEVYSYFQ